jgi:hypothetical protein
MNDLFRFFLLRPAHPNQAHTESRMPCLGLFEQAFERMAGSSTFSSQ